MFYVGRDDDGLSGLETTLFAVDLVAEGTGEDVESLGLVVVVVVRWGRGRLRSLALIHRSAINHSVTEMSCDDLLTVCGLPALNNCLLVNLPG
jgi:hypothetical protein